METHETRERALATALRERGQRATPQRLAIARVLTDLDRHVTAEHVHAEVSRRLPGVSLPTVYATLDLLEALGLARRVATEGGAVVYDPRTDEHHHLVCRSCGAIMDVDVAVDTAGVQAAALASGFRPDATQVVLRGLCADCAARPVSVG
jgi:Fe2+ or Zn2+ uptake regulation protein